MNYPVLAFCLANLAFGLLPKLFPAIYLLISLPIIISNYFYLPKTVAQIILFSYLAVVYSFMQATCQMPVKDLPKQITTTGLINSLVVYNNSDAKFNFKIADTNSKYNNKNVSLYWKNAPKLIPGEKYLFKLKLKPIHNLANPGSFDLRAYALSNKIFASGSVIKNGYTKLENTKIYRQPLAKIRQILREKIIKINANNKNLGIILALSLGDKSYLNNSDISVFQKTGTAHLIAISGLHVGIAAIIAYAFAYLAWRYIKPLQQIPRPKIVIVASMLAAFLYGALAGFSVATLRAVIMIMVFGIGELITVHIPLLNRLILSWFVLIIINPFATLSSGFYLSFLAVFFMIYGLNKSKNLSKKILFFKTQYVVTIGLIPITILVFKQSPLISPLVNLFLIPIFSFIITPLCLLGTIFSIFSLKFAQLFYFLANYSLNLLQPLMHYLASLSHNWYIPNTNNSTLIFITIAVLIILMPKKFPGKYISIFLFLPLFFGYQNNLKSGEAKITILEVNQGLSVFIKTKEHALLFDAGPKYQNYFDAGERVIKPFLKHNNIKALDKMIISHADLDHIGGARAILQEINVKEIITSFSKPLNEYYPSFCQRGDSWQWDGVDFKFLHPDYKFKGTKNNRSCVLLVTAFDKKILLTADIEKSAESYILSHYPDLTVDYLIVPHHGSLSSSSPKFIQSLSPKYGIFPVGFNNRYGFPKAKIVARYTNNGVGLLNTAEKGAIVITMQQNIELEQPTGYRDIIGHYWW